jgi:AraC-like DNA-binding protein
MKPTSEFWCDPALPYVESRRACHSRACYKPHSHLTYSIGAVDQGVSTFTGAGTAHVTLHAGTVVFVPASRVHACNPATDSAWSYQMLHLEASWLHAVRREERHVHPADETNGRFDGLEPVQIVSRPETYQAFCELNGLLFSAADASDKEAALIAFLGDWDATQGWRIEVPPVDPELVARLRPVFDLLNADPSAQSALSELAVAAEMSRYQLIRAFRKATGMTPHAWQLNQRINLARDAIRQGESLTDLAYRLGFADQAHFQRVFKAHTAVTPGHFRR